MPRKPPLYPHVPKRQYPMMSTPADIRDVFVEPVESSRRGETIWYSMPVEVVISENIMDEKVEILRGGHVRFTWPGWGRMEYELPGKIRDAVSDYFDELLDKEMGQVGKYWRFTNNRDEPKLAHVGQLRPSYNYRDKFYERGVSVARHEGYAIWGYKYGYQVSGNIIGYGSDGEPSLDPKTIKVLSPIKTIEEIASTFTKRKLEVLDLILVSYGWTRHQYIAMAFGNPEFVDSSKFYKHPQVREACKKRR